MNHIPYPSIEQYRHAIIKVAHHVQLTGIDTDQSPMYDTSIPLPVLKYQATVKLHGTNFAMGLNRITGETWFQSRESIITPEKDNAGAARFFSGKDLSSFFDKVPGDVVVIYGEWCGKGIQNTVAITQLPKMLVVFDAYIESENRWLSAGEVSLIGNPNGPVYSIYNFPEWEIEIDFNKPEDSLPKLIEITTEIADLCPVGKALGVNGIGEGAVWRCVTPGFEDTKFRFKVKDERHSAAPKVEIKEGDTEKETKIKNLAVSVTPSWRLEQMLEKVCDLNNGGKIEGKQVPLFLKALAVDIEKEECDVLQKESVSYDDISREVSNIGRQYFLKKLKGL